MTFMEAIESIVTDTEDNVFIGSFDDSVENYCCIIATGGAPADHVFVSKIAVRYATVQIRLRDASYESGWNRAEVLFNSLSGECIENYSIYATSDILSLGKDSRNLSEFSINFRITITI